ncbi:MAG: GNAT family N-acetyltransferase [Anaerolineae bacterium]|nr:GNAT family N-acetyltransferase [Anaerolineae bacterium]
MPCYNHAMTDLALRPAGSASHEERAALMNLAYADYNIPLHVDADALARMDYLYDVDPDASVVAERDGALIGQALLSRRGERAWVSAVGTVPAARRQGVARAMMLALIANARDLGLRDVVLEVISENTRAHALYLDLGFRDVRELLTWRLAADADPLPIPPELLSEAHPESVVAHFEDWHRERPCWQRELPTLRRMLGRVRAYTLALDGRPAGYCLVADRVESVSILDAGISPDFGAVRAGRPLLQALSRLHPNRALTIMNVPADDPLSRALAALRFHVTIRQWEMMLQL